MTTSKDKSTTVILFNQSGAPVVCSDEGHVLAAAERRTVNTPLDGAAQHAVDNAYLLVEPLKSEPDQDPVEHVAGKAATRSSGESTKER